MIEPTYTEDSGALQWEGEDVLHWQINFPTFSETKKCKKRLNPYYKKVSQTWERHWQNHIYPQVCTELQKKRSISHPFTPWKVSLSAKYLALSDHKISISHTATIKKGKGITFFCFNSDLWDYQQGIPLNPYKQKPILHWKKKDLLEKILLEAENERNLRFTSNYQEQILANKNKIQFFFTEHTLETHFPQATIAIPEEGIPRFQISL